MSFLIAGFGVVLLVAGCYHFINPAFYAPFMPDWFPKSLANTLGGLAEIIIGIGLLVPAWRYYALWAAAGLMLIFLPLHVIDLLRSRPVIGPHWVATLRLLLQVVLIWWLWHEAIKYR